MFSWRPSVAHTTVTLQSGLPSLPFLAAVSVPGVDEIPRGDDDRRDESWTLRSYSERRRYERPPTKRLYRKERDESERVFEDVPSGSGYVLEPVSWRPLVTKSKDSRHRVLPSSTNLTRAHSPGHHR